MSDDIEFPDPTELREKLGIGKPVRPLGVERYEQATANGTVGQIARLGERKGSAITLADHEPEPRIVDDAESAKIDEILKDCPASCARWLKQYIILGNKSAAFRAINYSAGSGYVWKRAHPTFAALLKFYEEEVRVRWNEVGERRGLEGFREDVYKPDGSLKFTRMRQDPQFMKALLQKVDPDWNNDQAAAQIVINVVREEE